MRTFQLEIIEDGFINPEAVKMVFFPPGYCPGEIRIAQNSLTFPSFHNSFCMIFDTYNGTAKINQKTRNVNNRQV